MVRLITLEEAAEALRLSPDEYKHPARVVRGEIRRHQIPYIRCGRTITLTEPQFRQLLDAIVRCPSGSVETPANPPTGISEEQWLSGAMGKRGPSGLTEVRELIAARRRKASAGR